MTDLEDGTEPEQTIDLAALREEYSRAGLAESDLEPDPLAMFDRWMREAVEADLYEPNAMVVATVGADFAPSARMVLLKGVDERGFVFYTNTGRARGGSSAANPRCALLFPWHPLERQVRVEGVAAPLGRDAREDVLRLPPAEVPARGLGLAPVPRRSGRPGGAAGGLRGGGATVRRPGAGARGVGRVRRPPEAIEFWQGRPGPDARPAGLPSRGRRLAHRAARALAVAARRWRDRGPSGTDRLRGGPDAPARCDGSPQTAAGGRS